MSSNVPERVGRELYEAPYKAAVDAGVSGGSFFPALFPSPFFHITNHGNSMNWGGGDFFAFFRWGQ
jgi:hypothetical protein